MFSPTDTSKQRSVFSLEHLTRETKERCYEQRSARGEAVESLIVQLDRSLEIIHSVDHIAENSDLDDTEKIVEIRSLLNQAHDEGEEATTIKNQLQSDLSEADYFDILEKKSLQMQNRAAPILKSICLNAQGTCALNKALDHFKSKDGAIDENAPMEFLRPEERAAVSKGKFRVSLYKALLFIHVRSGIKAGTLNLEHSYKYRPLEDYLISNQRWEKEKDSLLERAGLSDFADPEKALNSLDEELFAQYLKTNDRIRDGSNEAVRLTNGGSLRVTTPKLEENDAEPLRGLFPERQYISLCEVLATVDRHSHFLDEFQHWQQQYNRSKTQPTPMATPKRSLASCICSVFPTHPESKASSARSSTFSNPVRTSIGRHGQSHRPATSTPNSLKSTGTTSSDSSPPSN